MEETNNLQDRDSVLLITESILFAATEPVTAEQLSELFGDAITKEELEEVLSVLWERYERAPTSLQIVKIGSGFKMTTRSQYSTWIERFFTKRKEVSLSKAALEVLSIIAYRQPATIADVDQIRGVDSSGVIKGLLRRGLIAIKGRKKAPGRPLLLATTDKFLDHFGLEGLHGLPKPDEVREVELHNPESTNSQSS